MDNSVEIKTVSDGQFLKDLKILLRKCQLTSYIKGKQPAIVFDIDGTMVYDKTWDKPIWSVINFCNYLQRYRYSNDDSNSSGRLGREC